jgi:hypothetical protein
LSSSIMERCEIRKLFMRNGSKVAEWVEVPVRGLPSGSDGLVRCAHCHGAVRVHVQKVLHGPTDHVEHLNREDSEGCKGGHHFKGTHRMSTRPIE